MASYRPYPPQSSFGPSAGQSSLPPHPPPHRPPSHGNQYPQNWGSAPSFPQGYNQMPTSSHFQHSGYGNAYPAPSHHQPPAAAQPQQQPQQYPYTPPPPPPPDTSYPPPPPPPPPSVGQNVMNVQQQSQHGPMYFPSQYSQPPHLPPPPPPPSSPPSSSIPPPPPPPPSPPPIPSSVPSQNQAKESGAGPDRIRHERDGRASTEGSQHIASKQQKPPVHPIPAKKANGSSGRLETEEERRLRKKREMDKQRQEERHRQQLKESQNSVLQKTQNMASSSKAHGSVSGSRMGDRRATTLLSGERTENRLKRPSTFLCRMKFRNELPDPTAQPKLMTLKRDKDRFTRYNITSLEKMHKPKLYFEPDLGIPLDLLDLSVYNPPKEKLSLAPEDQELLRDDEPLTPLKKDGIRRKERPSDHGVSWLVKTQYISPLSSEGTRQSLTEKQAKELRETREGHNILENLNNRDRQIQEILASFEACKSRPVHATNKSLQPVEIMPLLPYFDRYDDQFVVVNFDGEPTADSEMFRKTEKSTRGACESKAIMKSFVAPGSDPEKPDRFLGYMVPSQDEVSKDMCGEDEDISFSWVREYNWDVKGEDLDDLSTYLVTFDENSASYLPLPTKLILRKRRAKEGRSYEEAEQFAPPAKVTVRRGDATAVIERKDLGASSFSKGSGSGMKRDSMYAEDDFVRLNTEDEELGQFSGADDYISE